MKFRAFLQSRRNQLIILILVTVLSYANILRNGFAFDDSTFILYWPSIKSNEKFSVILSLPFLLSGDLPSDHQGVYRPVRSVFYLVSFKIWGINPFGYHLQAIVIQISAVVLVYFITRLIIQRTFIPFMTAFLFATHPIHTESISFITASFDTIGVVFLFIAFYYYLSSQIQRERRVIKRFASYIYAFLAFFTYEMTLVLPLLIVLCDFCFKKLDFKNWRTRLKTYLPYFGLLIAYGLIRFVFLKIGNRADYLGEPWLKSAGVARLETPEIIWQYISWLLLPLNLTFAHRLPDHIIAAMVSINNLSSWAAAFINWFSNIGIVVPIATMLISLTAIVKFFSKIPVIAFGLSWFLLSLTTVINLVPQGASLAERFLYLPSFGFALLIAYLFADWYIRSLKYNRAVSYLVVSLFILTAVFYTTTTILRNNEWQNDRTLYSSALRVNPRDDVALNGLGLFYFRENQLDLAIETLEKAIALKPNFQTYRFNLGLVYERKGKLDLAEDSYKEAIKIEPKSLPPHQNLANLYFSQGRDELALTEYQAILEIDPGSADTHFNLGLLYTKQEKYELAVKEFQQATSLNPNISKFFNSLGVAYAKLHQFSPAIEAFKSALEISPQDALIHFNLAKAYEENGNINLAISEYQKGLEINPEATEIKKQLDELTNQI